MIKTTLNRIKKHNPCKDGWKKLLNHLGKTQADDEVLPFSVIVESNGLDDALWCCRAEPQFSKEWRLYAVWCARQVEHLMTDVRSRNALNVAEQYANGQATDEELAAARASASDAARASASDAAWAAARASAWDAAWAAVRASASDAAWAAARASAWDAASAAASDAARASASDAAWAAARASAWDAASAAARDAQKKKFLEIVG